MEKGASEIAKLTERLSKDPKSKLFVPLAEEYKKAGDIEMAIAVLSEGLKNNPGYVTAKSFLGRLLLDKGNLPEAQKEFEEVVKAIPDNVLAQRKLGDIHALQGRAQEALLFFKAVLAVNPKDPELKSLVAEIEAGRDVREKIAGPKYQPAAGQPAAAVPAPPSPAAPLPPIKPLAPAAVMPAPLAAPVSIPPAVDEEEPEEVFVFESLDEAVPAGVLKQPQAEQDMFTELASETGTEEAARMDEGVMYGGPVDAGFSEVPQPVSGSDAGLGNSFFDSEPAPIDAPAVESGFDAASAPELAAPVTEHELGSPDAGPGSSFFDSEPARIDIPSSDSGFDEAPVSELFTVASERDSASPDAGLPDTTFFDSGEMPAEPQITADVFDSVKEPAHEIPAGALMEAAAGDIPSEEPFFDVEPVDAAEEPRIESYREAGGEATPAAPDVTVPVLDSSAPEADDFTTDTLAELYIAQGFYEKAIEIYERMLADRPNSRLLKDKLANVRAMGSDSGADEEQGTPVLFEATGALPVPPAQPMSIDGARQWKAPGMEAEAKEYIPPPADDFESSAFESGFAPVEYVQPEPPGTAPTTSVGQALPVQDEEALPASLKNAASGKEQTIVRLDNWLKNIMKEK